MVKDCLITEETSQETIHPIPLFSSQYPLKRSILLCPSTKGLLCKADVSSHPFYSPQKTPKTKGSRWTRELLRRNYGRGYTDAGLVPFVNRCRCADRPHLNHLGTHTFGPHLSENRRWEDLSDPVRQKRRTVESKRPRVQSVPDAPSRRNVDILTKKIRVHPEYSVVYPTKDSHQ